MAAYEHKGTADTLRHVARARRRGWIQEDYPEGNGIKLTRYRRVQLPSGVFTGPAGAAFVERRTIYLVYFENVIVAYRLREDLSPTVRAPRARFMTRTKAFDYLEEYGADIDDGKPSDVDPGDS